MKQFSRRTLSLLYRAIPFAIILAIFFTVLFFPQRKEEGHAERRVVTVWNIDTFEGGKGSRTAFLKRAARRAEERGNGVWYLVTSYTAEGAEAALSAGTFPDALSFGIGFSGLMEQSLPLGRAFAGGQAGGVCLAYPWCRGRYSLFSLTEDFEGEGRTAIGVGGSNLSAVAAALGGIEGEERESLAAYTEFLNGTYRYLLGTQRDECRFLSRGVTVYRKDVGDFCDLYQYFSVLDPQKKEDGLLLLDELLSERTQEALAEVGMFPVAGAQGRTLSVFTSAETLAKLHADALSASARKNLDKYLKSI